MPRAQLELLDRVGVGMLIVIDGLVARANESAHRLMAAPPGTLIGRTTMEVFVDHTVDTLVRESITGSDQQVELTTATEPPRTVVVHARRYADTGASLLLEDVSELRRLRRIRTEFVDNLSHELRTPLTTVRLLTESLANELTRTKVPARIRDSVAKIEVETGHLAQMVSELVDLAAIEQGEAKLTLRDVDLSKIVGSTLDRLRPYAAQRDVQLQSDAARKTTDRTVRGDAGRLGQLAVNLVHNAIKFSGPGGQVTVRVGRRDDEVVIEVEDRGVGIPKRELERIFERFYKVDRSRSEDGPGLSTGTGLGLSIARHIAERHSARIWAESERGKGSRFTVAFPPRYRR